MPVERADDWNADHLPPLKCAGCTLCCHGDTIFLTEQDNPAFLRTEIVNGRLAIRKGKDGNCTYLEAGGCKLHHSQNKPFVCRLYDCRVDYQRSLKERGRAVRLNAPFVRQGKKLLEETGHAGPLAMADSTSRH